MKVEMGFERRVFADEEGLRAACAGRDEALRFLTKCRWPDGPACQWCESAESLTWDQGRARWNCSKCKKPTSLRKGTLLERSRLHLELVCVALLAAGEGRDPDGVAGA